MGIGFGGIFRKAPEADTEEKIEAAVPASETEADLDALFREALADGEVTGDIVAVDAQGREVTGRKRSNIFGA